MADCTPEVDKFLRRDLDNWTGLRADCNEHAVMDRFPSLPGQIVTRRGSDEISYTGHAVETGAFEGPVMMLFDDSALALLEVEYWSFDTVECKDLLDALGTPEARMPLGWRQQRYADAEWVYGGRGLALGVIPATGVIVRAAGFPPCTPELFTRRYQHVHLARELPVDRK